MKAVNIEENDIQVKVFTHNTDFWLFNKNREALIGEIGEKSLEIFPLVKYRASSRQLEEISLAERAANAILEKAYRDVVQKVLEIVRPEDMRQLTEYSRQEAWPYT